MSIGYQPPPAAGGGVTLPIAESDVTSLTADLAAKLAKASNLSDVASAATALTNLGVAAQGAPLGLLPAGTQFGDVMVFNGTSWVRADVGGLDSPAAYGMLEWNFSPAGATQQIAVSGTKYVLRVTPRFNRTVTNINLVVAVAGATLTTGQNLVALYGPTGTKLGSDSADQSTAWTSTGLKAIAIGGGAQSLTAGTNYYVEILSVGTTPPTFARGGSSVLGANLGVSSGSGVRYGVNGTGATATDASITVSGIAVTAALTFWVGFS